MVLLGDPLYRPFASHPRPSLVARAYRAGDSNRVLEKGETSWLLAEIECVGPPGTATPALSAIAEPEMGLAAASGSVAIPPLKAGQTAVIRIPSVTGGTEPTGRFRLRLNVQTQGEKSRRIVLDGRLGFSRLTGGLGPKSQMFVNPKGDGLISGNPGRAALIATETLQAQPITPPNGLQFAGVQFSPGGERAALALGDSNKAGVIITDNKLSNIQPLPAGTQFVRWLADDELLLKSSGQLIRHNLTSRQNQNVDPPADWNGIIAFSSVIPRSDVQVFGTQDGRLGVRRGAGPLREVLQGVKGIRSPAIANDLSLMGAMDAEKRLWIQHGLAGKPELTASGVEGLLWGPISRRALVADANRQGRVYDGRDRSWTELGRVGAAQWSPDEQRLLFIELSEQAPFSPAYLTLLTGKRIERLCEFQKLGTVAGMAFSGAGDKAYLLASLTGAVNVWLVALPPRTPQQ
jgi:hypothetical protein